ncbi:MAG: prephenate dehydrogenase/arogenate dehydrogenase family protein, partial [Alphaproteobacteria bacterium]
GDLAAQIAPALAPGAIVSDVGSVKMAVIRDVGPHLPAGVHFVPAHPVAGTEHSGPEAGFASLFEDRYCILTPPPGTDEDAVERLMEFWRRTGSRVERMDARHHDRVLAVTSHVPHLIAYTIVGTASDLEEQLRGEQTGGDVVETAEVIKFSAGGFRDFTRIAASDPVMWRDIFLNNREAVLEILGRFVEDLTAMQRAIRWGEGDRLERHFERGRAIRRSVVEMGQAGSFQATEPAAKTPKAESGEG